MTFSAWSPSLQGAEKVPNKYVYNGMGCTGKNISPPIEWSDAPEETKSFAVTVFDPDAPHAGGWWHWAVVNIPADVHALVEGASNENKLPEEAVEIKTDFGDTHYGGPCPPAGDSPHHYIFTVYALKDKKINLSSDPNPGNVRQNLEQDCLAKSSFIVEYNR